MVNHYQSKSKTEIKFQKRFNKESDDNKNVTENESKDKFILNCNQLFILDTLDKTKINDINNGNKSESGIKFDENLFNYKNFDKELVKLGLTEGPNIDFEKMTPEEVKSRRQALEEKYKTLKNEDKFTLSKTRVVIRNLPSGVDSAMMKYVINNKLGLSFGKNKK